MRRNRLIPMIVACALFMENAESAILATALPTIAADLGVAPTALKLALTSYLIALAVFIPVSGWLADRYGARRVFVAAILVFMTASVSCAMVSSLEGFVLARACQGAGGAMMVPVGRLIILRSVQKHELVDAMAYLTIPALIGPVIGPPLGGLITTALHWRWIFLINVPIGLIGLALALAFIPNLREEGRPRLDWRGFLLSAVGLSGLTLGASLMGVPVAPREVAVGLMMAGAAATGLYVLHARSHPDPILDLRLFRHVTLRVSVIGGSLFRVGIGATPFLLPLLLQLGFGLNALQSGALTFAGAAGALFMKTIAARLLRRFGFRRVLMVNGVLAAGFIGAMATFTPATPGAVIIATLLIGGFFRSLQFTSFNVIGFADVEERETSRATSLTSVAQQVSLACGVAAGAFLLEAATRLGGRSEPVWQDFGPAFLGVATISGLCAIVAWFLPPGAGAQMTARKP